MKRLILIGSVILVPLLSMTMTPSLAAAAQGTKACHVRLLAKSPAPRWKRTCREVAERKAPVAVARADDSVPSAAPRKTAQ